MSQEHSSELDQKSASAALIAQSDDIDLTPTESGYGKSLRMLFFFPISIGEMI